MSSSEYDYETSLPKLDPEELAKYMPGWTYESKVFDLKGSKPINRGWIFEPPGKYLFMQVEKEAKRAHLFSGKQSIYINGVASVATQTYPNLSLVRFISRQGELSLWIPENEQTIRIKMETGRKYPNTTKIDLEVTPQSRLKISPGTTLGELAKYL